MRPQAMGLTWEEYTRHYLPTLRRTHERRVSFTVTDLEHRTKSTITPRFVEGQVTGDTGRDVARMLEATFLDPSRSIRFDPDSPSGIPLHRQRMIQVGYSVKVPALGRWVTCEVFTGPVWDFDRSGAEVRVVAHGKERLALGQAGRTRVFPKKTRKTRVIREILTDAGETRLAVPDLAVTMPDRLVVARMDARWKKARRVAASMNRQLFYDGSGVAILRRRPQRPVFTVDERLLMSEVTVDRDSEGLVNTWEVLGGKPRGNKQRVRAQVALPDAHPMSAKSLGRNGRRHYLIHQSENPHVKTRAEAVRKARDLRDDQIRLPASYRLDLVPVPHLEDGDLLRVVTGEGVDLVRFDQWTLPLGVDGDPVMSVGAVRRTRMTVGAR